MRGHETPEWGELYDAKFPGPGADVPFYVAEAERSGGPVLEIGCGTGRILLPTAERGVESWGIDLSRAALDRLALKAERQRLKVTTFQADMRAFCLPCQFALITVPNRAFLHMTTTQDQVAALENFRQHLAPGGRLLLNFFHPTYRSVAGDDFEGSEDGRITLPDSGRNFHTALSLRRERVHQLVHVTYRFEEEAGEGSRFEVSFTLRWIFKGEFALLLRAAGFQRWQVCGGFHGEPLQRDDQEMVWTAWP